MCPRAVFEQCQTTGSIVGRPWIPVGVGDVVFRVVRVGGGTQAFVVVVIGNRFAFGRQVGGDGRNDIAGVIVLGDRQAVIGTVDVGTATGQTDYDVD